MHGVDVERRRLGIDEALMKLLGAALPLPITYAGGASVLEDL
jgi:phosphoribosylformimino-5-aminoimidazole carboxamide ribotide isomerase